MAMLVLALLLLAAVLVSSVIDQLVPKVSSPLIQIRPGPRHRACSPPSQIRIGLDRRPVPGAVHRAPCCTTRRKAWTRRRLWRNRKPVLSLAIGLVVVTALVLGFAVHAARSRPSRLVAGLRARRRARSHRRRGRGLALQGNRASPERQQEHPRGRVAHQRRLRHRGVPVRASRPPSPGHVLPPRRHSRLRLFSFFGGILVGRRPGLPGQLPRAPACAPSGLENTTFHVLFEVFTPFIVYLVANALRRERHPRRGGGRPGERRLAACHRAVHLAHEHRLDQRLAGAVLRAQRRGVRVAGHAAAAAPLKEHGKARAVSKRQAHRVRAGSRLHRDLRTIRLGDGHGMGAQPRRTRRSPIRVGERAHGCRHDPGRPKEPSRWPWRSPYPTRCRSATSSYSWPAA